MSCLVSFENTYVYTTTEFKRNQKAPTDHCFVVKVRFPFFLSFFSCASCMIPILFIHLFFFVWGGGLRCLCPPKNHVLNNIEKLINSSRANTKEIIAVKDSLGFSQNFCLHYFGLDNMYIENFFSWKLGR